MKTSRFLLRGGSELKTGNLKLNVEMFLSSIVDTFNVELLKEREIFK